jgi:hypothetical protein
MNESKGFAQLDADAARKRCALALHAVASRDREWVLAQLPAAQRTELEQLVRELRELGIPADSRMAQDALRRRPASKAAPTRADASDMADLLEQEPPLLIAHALMLHNTSCEAVLALLSANKRRQVQQLLGSVGSTPSLAPLPPALSRSLSDELAIRLRQRPKNTPARKSTLARRRWLAWVGLARTMQ